MVRRVGLARYGEAVAALSTARHVAGRRGSGGGGKRSGGGCVGLVARRLRWVVVPPGDGGVGQVR